MNENNNLKNSKGQFATSKDVQEIGAGLGMLIEKVHDDVKLVAEQFGDVKKKLDAHTKILNDHTEMIGKIMIELAIVKEDISVIKHDLKRKVDYDEFASLERRVLLLEKRK